MIELIPSETRGTADHGWLKAKHTFSFADYHNPEQENLVPGYEQKRFSREEKLNQLRLIASRDGRGDSVTLHQRVDLYASILDVDTEVELAIADSNKVFMQVVQGDISVNGQKATAGDGIQITDQDRLVITCQAEAEFLVFDMG